MLEINGLETAYGQSQVLFGMELNVGKGGSGDPAGA